MNGFRGRRIAVVALAFALIVAACLAVGLIMDRRAVREDAANAEKLNAEVRPYQKELTERKDELALRREQIRYMPPRAQTAIGYQPATASQLAYIRQQIEKIRALSPQSCWTAICRRRFCSRSFPRAWS